MTCVGHWGKNEGTKLLKVGGEEVVETLEQNSSNRLTDNYMNYCFVRSVKHVHRVQSLLLCF